MRRLERAEKMMIRRMCGVTLRHGKSSQEIRKRLGIVSVSDLVRQGRLRCLGMWNLKMQMTGCQLVETWQFQGKEVEVEVEKHGRNGWQMA